MLLDLFHPTAERAVQKVDYSLPLPEWRSDTSDYESYDAFRKGEVWDLQGIPGENFGFASGRDFFTNYTAELVSAQNMLGELSGLWETQEAEVGIDYDENGAIVYS